MSTTNFHRARDIRAIGVEEFRKIIVISQQYKYSRLSFISNSKGLAEALRDIRTSTYQS